MARNPLAPMITGALLAAIGAFSLSSPASGSINLGTTDASDGAFSPTTNTVVDLSQAVTGTWDQDNSANAGKGVYDPAKWAVVFKYSSVNIPAGVTVTFKNHPSGAPVVWLVQGNVSITGTVNLNGQGGATSGLLAEPGPGGFRGGAGLAGLPRSAGFGPGGGSLIGGPSAVGGSYGTAGGNSGGSPSPTYGNAQVLPLLGGSGSAAYTSATYDGGAGGGCILIASTSGIAVSGNVLARGGLAAGSMSGGSGGGIRVVCDSISGTGTISAIGGNGTANGGAGRIRIEANQNTLNINNVSPPPSVAAPAYPTTTVWPPTSTPSVSIASVGGVPAASDPYGAFAGSSHLTNVSTTAPLTVSINAVNVPVDGTWKVMLRVVPRNGLDISAAASFISGDASASVWEASGLTLPLGFSALQVRAYKQ